MTTRKSNKNNISNTSLNSEQLWRELQRPDAAETRPCEGLQLQSRSNSSFFGTRLRLRCFSADAVFEGQRSSADHQNTDFSNCAGNLSEIPVAVRTRLIATPQVGYNLAGFLEWAMNTLPKHSGEVRTSFNDRSYNFSS
jgi:hypothetical protein